MMVDPWIFQLLQLAASTSPMYLLIILLELLLLSQSHAIQLAKNQQRELTFNDPVIIFSTHCKIKRHYIIIHTHLLWPPLN